MNKSDSDTNTGYTVTASASLEYTRDEATDELPTPEAAEENVKSMIRSGELRLNTSIERDDPTETDEAPKGDSYTHEDLGVTFPVPLETHDHGIEIEAVDHTFVAGDVLETRDDQHPDEYRLVVNANCNGLILYHQTEERFSHYPAEWVEQDFDDDVDSSVEYIIHPRPDRA